MNLLFSTIGRRGYLCEYFKEAYSGSKLTIYATSNTEYSSGFCYSDKNLILPAISEPDYKQSVLNLIQAEKINGVLSFFDLDVYHLSTIKNKILEAGAIPLIPDLKIADICFDKFKTFEFLKSNHFLTPETFLNFDSFFQGLASDLIKFPVIIKPRFGFASKGIYVCHNEEQLRFFSNYIGEEYIIQAIIKGQEHSFDILNDFNNNTISVIVKKKLLMRSGETDISVTVKNQKYLEEGVRLSNALKNTGPLDVDFFIDEFGNISILELNPRFGGGYPGSHLAGANFPAKILAIINGNSIKPDIGNYQENVTMMKDVRINQKIFKTEKYK